MKTTLPPKQRNEASLNHTNKFVALQEDLVSCMEELLTDTVPETETAPKTPNVKLEESTSVLPEAPPACTRLADIPVHKPKEDCIVSIEKPLAPDEQAPNEGQILSSLTSTEASFDQEVFPPSFLFESPNQHSKDRIHFVIDLSPTVFEQPTISLDPKLKQGSARKHKHKTKPGGPP
ncbi:hypothetical protein QJS04_geneDACA002650 [Acorus gramineus]|uniref:Uncharacterized protein n=1 Tax=Acorus gramineus TaxID=55184 RepID=A0AAV9ASM1_ACOGR|nr:hypothetical protein QJS04_geneDACA002650 [Acorus gramineus]